MQPSLVPTINSSARTSLGERRLISHQQCDFAQNSPSFQHVCGLLLSTQVTSCQPASMKLCFLKDTCFVSELWWSWYKFFSTVKGVLQTRKELNAVATHAHSVLLLCLTPWLTVMCKEVGRVVLGRSHHHIMAKAIHPCLSIDLTLHGTGQLLWERVSHELVLRVVTHRAVTRRLESNAASWKSRCL